MSDATKQKAIRKLETMQVKIGYPDQWPAARDMMQVTPISEGGSLLSNLLVSMQVAIDDSLNKLGTKVDRSEWDVTPQTINAMYDPLNNEIIFPAAILQAPFYDSDNSDGANLGGIGLSLPTRSAMRLTRVAPSMMSTATTMSGGRTRRWQSTRKCPSRSLIITATMR